MSRSTPSSSGSVEPVEAVDSARGNGNGHGKRRHQPWRRRRDWGGVVARVLCMLFAIVGLVPLGLGALVRLDRVQDWAAARTSHLLHEQLGLDARYELVLRPWPLMLSMENVELAASDGGQPVLRARSVIARPRIFSLLAGKIDFGEVEIEEPELRVVIRDGKLVNLDYRLPESDETSTQQELPLSAVALTNARVDLTVDDVSVRSRAIDVDLTLDNGPIELSLRAGESEVDTRRADPAHEGQSALDEDRLCSLELRARLAPDELLVRRLALDGAVDLDPAPGSRPACDLPDDDWRRVHVEVNATTAQLGAAGQLERLDGRARVRAPVPLVHRFVDLPPTSGWIDLDLEHASYERSQKLPDVSGRLRADDLGIDSKMIARNFDARIATKSDTVVASGIHVVWAGGKWSIDSAIVKPFEKGMPLEAHAIVVDGVTMPELLDDINVHPHAHVGWNIDHTEVESFGGTLQPMALSGAMKNTTRDFAIYDSPASSPNKHLMMGVERGDLTGTFKVTPDAIVLSNFTLIAPHSKLRTTVSIYFDERFGLNVYEGSEVDLRDISPLVDLDLKGLAKVDVSGHGTFDEPVIDGKLSVDDFEFAGFGIGDIVEADAHFVPLQLEFHDAKLVSGQSHYDVPRLKLDFDDGDAGVVLSAQADTRRSGLRMADFFGVLNLAGDPRWSDLDGTGFGVADIDYVLGGHRDRCGGGNLRVRGNMDFKAVTLWGEPFDSGGIELDYRWDDINAGDHGLDVDIQSALLRKGTGSLIASGTIRHGAKLAVDVTGTAIPLERVRAFQDLFGGPQREDDPQRKVRPEADVSFIGRLGGSLDRMEARAEIDVSTTRIGPDVLPSSQLSMQIVPTAPPRHAATRSRCGNDVLPVQDPTTSDPDAVQGVIRLAGNLFEGQITFDDLEITQQQHSMASGQLNLSKLDLGPSPTCCPTWRSRPSHRAAASAPTSSSTSCRSTSRASPRCACSCARPS